MILAIRFFLSTYRNWLNNDNAPVCMCLRVCACVRAYVVGCGCGCGCGYMCVGVRACMRACARVCTSARVCVSMCVIFNVHSRRSIEPYKRSQVTFSVREACTPGFAISVTDQL